MYPPNSEAWLVGSDKEGGANGRPKKARKKDSTPRFWKEAGKANQVKSIPGIVSIPGNSHTDLAHIATACDFVIRALKKKGIAA
jgi:hypothetical protein